MQQKQNEPPVGQEEITEEHVEALLAVCGTSNHVASSTSSKKCIKLFDGFLYYFKTF
jgi:hypothetical protein